MQKHIGLIGVGDIGSYVFDKIKEEHSDVDVSVIYRGGRKQSDSLESSIVADTIDDLRKHDISLMVEMANANVVKELGVQIVQFSDLLVLSITALADGEFFRALTDAATKSGKSVFIPHAAIIGLDGIYDGREIIEEVEIVTTKSPNSLGFAGQGIDKTQVIYEGSTRGACKLLPRNVNVHAAVAIAGLGFDKTRSKIVAEPGFDKMEHVITVKGQGLRWRVELQSESLGGVTGSYTPESVYQTIKRICTDKAAIRIV